MTVSKKYANENFEEIASATTRTVSNHGLTKSMRREKRYRNRQARRFESRMHFRDEEV